MTSPRDYREFAGGEDVTCLSSDGSPLWGVPFPPGPCAKVRVFATLTGASGKVYKTENICRTPQVICPREEGEGYEKCKTICNQVGHAETQAIALAGEDARGGSIVVSYDRICCSCLKAIKEAGVARWECEVGGAYKMYIIRD